MPRPVVSFEFFPPKNLEASFRLWDCVSTLAPLDPAFVSVTYGAGGTARELTHEAVGTIHKTSGLRVAATLSMRAPPSASLGGKNSTDTVGRTGLRSASMSSERDI